MSGRVSAFRSKVYAKVFGGSMAAAFGFGLLAALLEIVGIRSSDALVVPVERLSLGTFTFCSSFGLLALVPVHAGWLPKPAMEWVEPRSIRLMKNGLVAGYAAAGTLFGLGAGALIAFGLLDASRLESARMILVLGSMVVAVVWTYAYLGRSLMGESSLESNAIAAGICFCTCAVLFKYSFDGFLALTLLVVAAACLSLGWKYR